MKTICTVDELRTLCGEPAESTKHKLYSYVNPQAEDFIARSPFLVMSTCDPTGQPTASPKGDSPGFVRFRDKQTLDIPERQGNRLLFSLQNILENPKIGLTFFLPGTNETLRIGGTAELTADPELCSEMAVKNKDALLVVRVSVAEAYFHCGKAFLRSGLWSPETWGEKMKVSFGKEIEGNAGGGADFIEKLDCYVEERYKEVADR